MNLRLLAALMCALPTASFAQTCEMKLGAMGPMSGGAAQWGLAMNSAAELAAAEVNAEGGVKIRRQDVQGRRRPLRQQIHG